MHIVVDSSADAVAECIECYAAGHEFGFRTKLMFVWFIVSFSKSNNALCVYLCLKPETHRRKY